MLARVFTLRFDSVLEGFDDRPLRDFLKDKEVLSLREHFFTKNEIPYLAVFITYQLQPVAAQAVVPESRNQREASWRELVSEAEVPLFNTLRDWRAERCKREGIPPYVLCTNKQLARIEGKKWRRFRRVVRKKETLHRAGHINEETLARSVCSMVGHILHADTRSARQQFFAMAKTRG